MLVLCVLFLSSPAHTAEVSRVDLSQSQNSIFNDLSWSLKIMMLKENLMNMNARRVGVQARTMGRQMDEDHKLSQPTPTEDTDMKLKLFRLMYETVRDSDLKVKRAELINSYYVNSTSFEIGYLMGDVTDKFNIMSDISMTLKRLYTEWKPIEHINAYEQIANQAIEISHLIEIMRSVNNKHVQNSHSKPDDMS